MSDYETVLTERIGNVGVVTMNRPKQMNALNQALEDEIVLALNEFDADDTIGCMILAGNEKCFCAGADLKWIASMEFVEAFRSNLGVAFQAVAACRKPIIAAVSGYAFGGGTELSAMCDIILASESAVFGLPEVTLGVIPGAGGTQRLPQRIGKAKAMYYLLTGRNFKAEEAERIGFITQVVPGGYEKLMEEAQALAADIAKNPRLSLLAGKEAVNQQSEMPLGPGLAVEHRLFHGLFGTPDQKEGMTAFAQKRKPNYTKY